MWAGEREYGRPHYTEEKTDMWRICQGKIIKKIRFSHVFRLKDGRTGYHEYDYDTKHSVRFHPINGDYDCKLAKDEDEIKEAAWIHNNVNDGYWKFEIIEYTT